MTKISIIGSGWVGTAVGRGFSKLGYDVIFYDVVEKDLPNFTMDIDYAIENSSISFICVPTPSTQDGIDLSYVKDATGKIGGALKDKEDLEARYALCLGTDLGGYSIMLGGTSGGHLGSFSLVDVLTHGRACAILNPYYTVLFSSAIQDQLKRVAKIYVDNGYMDEAESRLEGRELAEAVARGMINFAKRIKFPTTLKEAGATERHIERMVNAAKDPQLKMKLENMPVPLRAEAGDVDRLMKPTLEAAYTGDFSLIPEVKPR